MAKLGSLFISLFADTAQFSSGLNKAKADLNSSAAIMNRGLASIDTGLKNLTKSILPIIGISGLGAILKQALDTAGALGELSEQLGISTDLIQSLRYNAAQSGVEAAELDGAIQKLGRSIGEAAAGNKTYLESFNELGVGVLGADGKIRSTEEVLRDVSDALARIPDKATRSRLEVELFGRAGQQLAPILEHGSAQIDAFTESARKAGVVLDSEAIAAADRASDAMAALGIKFDVFWQKVAAGLAGPGKGFVDFMDDLVRSSAETGLENRLGRIGDAMQSTRQEIADLENQVNSTTDAAFKNLAQAALDNAKKNLRSLEQEYQSVSKTLFGSTGNDRGEQGRRGLLPISAPPRTSNPPPKPAGAGSKSDAQKDEEEAQKMIADLERQIENLDASPLQEKVSDAISKIGQASDESKTAVANFTSVLENKTEAQKRDAEETAEYLKIVDDASASYDKRVADGKQLAESLRTPQEAYKARLEDLSAALKTGTIDQDTYNRALLDAQDTYIDQDKNLSLLKESWSDLGDAGVSALEDLAIEGGSLSDVLKGLLKDLERIALRAGVSAIAGSVFSGVGDWLGGLIAGGFHEGGIAGGRSTFSRSMPSAVFAGAPRLHGGGFVGPGEVPAILKRGEGVFTPEQMAAMGGSSGTVNNINVTVNGSGGTPSQNRDMADQTAKAIERMLDERIDRRMMEQRRTGNGPGLTV
jgi:hypothetical protein